MLTPFGKEFRILRIRKNLSLRATADILGKSPSYISSIETGSRMITDSVLEEILNKLHLSDTEKQDLYNAAMITRESVSINFDNSNKEQVDLALAFARNLNRMNSDEIASLLGMMEALDEKK